MRIGTANIQNFPDMPPEDVVADAQAMSKLCDLWGHQENQPGEDVPVILANLSNDWAVVHGRTALPIFYRKSVYTVLGTRTTFSEFEPELPLTPRPRIITGAGFKLTRRPEMPPFAVVNCHLIANAYNGDLEARRASQWDIEFADLRQFVGEYRRKKRSVITLGDFNNPRPPKPARNFQWLVGEKLDKIGVAPVGGIQFDEVADGTVELHSNHLGQWTRVLMS